MFSYDILMVSYDFAEIFLWYSYDFLWYSYDFLWFPMIKPDSAHTNTGVGIGMLKGDSKKMIEKPIN